MTKEGKVGMLLFTALQVDWFLEVSLHLLFHVIVA
jgi:hypothetical protein